MPLALASDEERLAGKRFDALDAEELAQLYRLMSRLELATPLRRTRRRERGRHGQHVDLRRTLRASLRTAGDPIGLARAAAASFLAGSSCCATSPGRWSPTPAPTCSSSPAPPAAGDAEAFVFATRLTRVTRALAGAQPGARDPARAAATAPDWSSGTRIGDALKTFNDRHGRRGMARGAVVVILSDGWERGDPALVGREMERLARLAHRIVWVNPRVSAQRVRAARGRHGRRAAALRRAGERAQLRARSTRSSTRSAARRVEPPGARGRRGARAVGERDAGAGQLGRDAERLRPEPRQHDTGMGDRWLTEPKICIYPGCERPAVPPHPLGGPQPAFCDLEEHNALTAHQERQRLAPRPRRRKSSG